MGNYNPDWAITVNIDGEKATYFVIETKGSSDRDDLRTIEEKKIDCGFKHFDLVSDVTYDYCVDYDDFSDDHIMGNL